MYQHQQHHHQQQQQQIIEVLISSEFVQVPNNGYQLVTLNMRLKGILKCQQ